MTVAAADNRLRCQRRNQAGDIRILSLTGNRVIGRIVWLDLEPHIGLRMLPGCPRRRLVRAVAVAPQADLERRNSRLDLGACQIDASHVRRCIPGDARRLCGMCIVTICAFDMSIIDDGWLDRVVSQRRILYSVRRELIDDRHHVLASHVAIVARGAILLLAIVPQ